jgi:hypothetical protein
MNVRISAVPIGLVGIALALAACEPATLTEARNQLGRGGARTFSLAIPISQDTFFVAKFLPRSDTATTPSGLLAIKLPAESLASAVGQQLAFNNLTLQTFQFSYDQMLAAAPDSGSVTATFAPRLAGPVPGIQLGPPSSFLLDTLRFATAQGSEVTQATIATGSVSARIVNNTACGATVTQPLIDSTGATVLTLPATAVGANATVTVTQSAASASFKGFLVLAAPTVTTGACVVPLGQTLAVRLSTTALTLSSVTLRNISESFTQSYAMLAGEARLNAVDTVLVSSGSFAFTVRNRLPVPASLNVTLNGVTRGGTAVTFAVVVPAASGGGSYATASASVNLAGATIRPAAVTASVSGTVSAASATVTSTLTTNAEVVDGTGSLIVQALAGRLDPTLTPELNIAVEEYKEIQKSQLDFGDLQDAVKGARINDATGALTIRNTAQTPLALANVTLGVVQLDAFGVLRRDALGHPLYERDSTTANLPLLVTIAPAGATRLSVPRQSSATLSLQMAPLVNRLVHLLLNNVRAAVVTAGTAVAGDGSQSRITRNDSAGVKLQLTVGMDITLPDSGIVFTRTEYASGADLGTADSASLVNRLASAAAVTDVVNGTPFAMTVDIAIVGDSVPSTTDVFTLPGRVNLGPLTVAGSPVDAAGRVTTPAASSQTVALTGNDTRPLLGRKFTTGIRIRLRPPPGGTGRGALRTTDQLLVKSHATVVLNAGGGQ